MVAARIAKAELGENQYTEGSENLPTQSQASELLSVSDRSIRTAKKVQRQGIDAGYSKKTAYSQGQRLLKNVEIQKAIEKAQGLENY
jgi:hypothetical protein